LICGDQEVQDNTVSVRTRLGKKINNVNIDDFIKKLTQEIFNHSMNLLEE
jgi:threonyl-tRNA synthetase